MDSHVRALEAMYVNAPVNQFFRPSVHVDEGRAVVHMAVRPDMHHAAHAAHGAVCFKMLDDAAFFAVQSLVTDVFVLTVSFQVYLLVPVADGEMVASGSRRASVEAPFYRGVDDRGRRTRCRPWQRQFLAQRRAAR